MKEYKKILDMKNKEEKINRAGDKKKKIRGIMKYFRNLISNIRISRISKEQDISYSYKRFYDEDSIDY